MKWLITLFVLIQAAVMPSAVLAQDGTASRTVIVQSWEEEWNPATQSWVRIAGSERVERQLRGSGHSAHQAARYAFPAPHQPQVQALANYGPFQVISPNRAAMIGSTGPMSPHQFAAMLRDYPGIDTLELVDAPGTNDDIANLQVGRMIRDYGIATHVPRNGSVRSGAVELFLAGSVRTMEDGARFAVHSWLDHLGRQPQDFAPDAPENRFYLDYYQDMGMSAQEADAFYAMTNSVPHQSAKWLNASEMRAWVEPKTPIIQPAIQPDFQPAEQAVTINLVPAPQPTPQSTSHPAPQSNLEAIMAYSSNGEFGRSTLDS